MFPISIIVCSHNVLFCTKFINIQVYSKVSFATLIEILTLYYFHLDEINIEEKNTKTVIKIMNVR